MIDPQTEVVWSGEIHPFTAILPPMPEDEMQQLAASIRDHGLLEPITLDPHGVLLDGKLRLAACEIAGVPPRFTVYAGDDQDAFIESKNFERQHLSAGQAAMVGVKAAVVGWGLNLAEHSAADLAARLYQSEERIAMARTVMLDAPDLVDSVIRGSTWLNEAFAQVAARHQIAARDVARFARMQRESVYLGDEVREGRLPFDAAWVALLVTMNQVGVAQADDAPPPRPKRSRKR